MINIVKYVSLESLIELEKLKAKIFIIRT